MKVTIIIQIKSYNFKMISLSIIVTIGVVILIIAILLYLAGKCCHNLPYYGMASLTSPLISYRSSSDEENISINSEVVVHPVGDIETGSPKYEHDNKKFISLCDAPEYTPRPQVMLT